MCVHVCVCVAGGGGGGCCVFVVFVVSSIVKCPVLLPWVVDVALEIPFLLLLLLLYTFEGEDGLHRDKLARTDFIPTEFCLA